MSDSYGMWIIPQWRFQEKKKQNTRLQAHHQENGQINKCGLHSVGKSWWWHSVSKKFQALKKKLLKKMQLNTFMEKTSNKVGIEAIHCCWVTESCQTLCDSYQAPLSIDLPRQEYWRGLPCAPPGDLPDPGIKPASFMSPALQEGSLPLSHLGSPEAIYLNVIKGKQRALLPFLSPSLPFICL